MSGDTYAGDRIQKVSIHPFLLFLNPACILTMFLPFLDHLEYLTQKTTHSWSSWMFKIIVLHKSK